MGKIDDSYLIRLKQMGWDDERIAKRFLCTVAEVQKRWNELVNLSMLLEKNGYGALQTQFGQALEQYRSLGENFKLLGVALGNHFSRDEVRKLVLSCPAITQMYEPTSPSIDEIVNHLLQNAILLKPYSLPEAEKIVQQAEKSIKESQRTSQN